MIQLSQLSMSYGHKLLFTDVDLLLSAPKHYALVGANGVGKSTLLRLITGEEEALSGTIQISKDTSIGWLKQDQFRYEHTIILEIVLQGRPKLWQALCDKEQLLQIKDWDEKTAHHLSRLEEIIAEQDGYSAEAFAEKLLIGLGIPIQYHYETLSNLSGGYKLRVLLAQALFQNPDILLLDEPTNHLDILSIRWLEQYLKQEFQGMVLFISHDLAFINRIADHILDMDYGEIRIYPGNYSKFLAEKKFIEEQKLQEKKHIEQKIADLQGFVDRFSAGTRSKQAQSRVKMMEKIELPDVKNSSRAWPHFHFMQKRPSGKQVLRVKHLGKSYSSKKIFTNLNFDIARGEKVAILGENGIGKSTLLKVLLHKIEKDQGEIEWGYEAQISYFSQDHHELLNTSISVLDWLIEMAPGSTEQNIRKILGQVLFKSEDVDKNILSLSGGEAARLLLARSILEAGNILILDEPTNHLDIESTEALGEALKTYPGTIIIVSHDRHFISAMANRILYFSHQRPMLDFKGDFQTFEHHLNNMGT